MTGFSLVTVIVIEAIRPFRAVRRNDGLFPCNTDLRSSQMLREGIKPSPTKRNASMT